MSPDYYARVSEVTAYGQELFVARPDYQVNDEGYGMQEYLDYTNMRDTWNKSRGEGVKVAIIDTGIDTDNPEFTGRISDRSYNASEDKVVKDYGMDVIEDEQGHGTSVAGVIGAGMNDGIGITGIAPEAELIIIKCRCDESGQFARSSDLVFGLAYAIEADADVVNMSFSLGINIFEKYTKLAIDSDVICVASAGNGETSFPTYPAADENVIGVGALEAGGWKIADYSNFGDNSDLLAPGTTYTTQNDGTYSNSTGTSLSSPIVAASVALYLSGNPHTEFSRMKELLQASSLDIGTEGEDWYNGYGLLDIYGLVCEEKGTVTYNMQTDEIEDMSQIYVKNHTLQSIPEPERESVVLDGWFYDPECTDEINYYEDIYTTDVTLYAGWINEDDGTAYIYHTLDDDTVEIDSYTGKRRYLTIPSQIEGKDVTSIGEQAFMNNSRLRTVTLPSTLNNISDMAFMCCTSLRSIDIPGGLRVLESRPFRAVQDCQRLSWQSRVNFRS